MKTFKKLLCILLSIVLTVSTFSIAITAKAANTTYVSDVIGIGDTITLGKYNDKPIVWRCVDIDENGPLMLAEDVLCSKEYDAAGENSTYHTDGWGRVRKTSGSNCWYDSNIRQWLNSNEEAVTYTHCPPSYSSEAGFLTNFSSSELSLIKKTTRLVNVNIWESKRSGYCDGGSSDRIYSVLKNSTLSAKSYYYKYITDNIFLISALQFNNIYNRNSKYLKTSSEYWTCICYGNNYACYELVSTINADGSLHSSYNQRGACDKTIGVRPAFYLNIDVYEEYINDYSYLMADSWKNAANEIFNKHFINLPSISKTIVNSYKSDKKFMKSVAGWQGVNILFEPAETGNIAISMKTYYSSVLMSLINANILDSNFTESIKESSAYESTKVLKELTAVINDCDDIDKEKILAGGKITSTEVSSIKNKINSFSSITSNIDDFLSAGTTINDGINKFINYTNVSNTSKYITNVLKGIKNNTDKLFLKTACEEIIVASENAFNSCLTGIYEGTTSVANDLGSDAINSAWEKFLVINPISQGALIGYKVGKPLANFLFNVDPIISNYYEFCALSEIEDALKITISNFENEFYNNTSADSSLNYINSISLFFDTYYLSFDFAKEQKKYVTHAPFEYIFFNGKQKYEDYCKMFDSIQSDMKDAETQLFRLWTISLKENYPEIYNDISSSLNEVNTLDFTNAEIRLEFFSKTFTGEAITPTAKVVLGGVTVPEDEYMITYNNNINPGLAQVTITSTSRSIYTGSKTVNFIIEDAPYVKRSSFNTIKNTVSTFSLDTENTTIEYPDVSVYDGDTLVASVVNGTIECNNIPVYVSENGIDILMQDKDYNVNINSNDVPINVEIETLDSDYSATSTVNYNYLTSTDINCEFTTDSNTITCDGEVISPDFSSDNVSDLTSYTITSKQCAVDSTAYANQIVHLSASIPEGYIFEGWTISPDILLNNNGEVTSFVMPEEDISITANISKNEFYFTLKDAISNAKVIEQGSYTDYSYTNLQNNIENAISFLSNDIDETTTLELVDAIENSISLLAILGDTTCDKKISIRDVTYLQMYLVHLITFEDEYSHVADVTNDGTITINDATQIQKYLARIVDKLGS